MNPIQGKALDIGKLATISEQHSLGIMVTKMVEIDIDIDNAYKQADVTTREIFTQAVIAKRAVYMDNLIKRLDSMSLQSTTLTEWMNLLNTEKGGVICREEQRSLAALQIGELLCRKLRDLYRDKGAIVPPALGVLSLRQPYQDFMMVAAAASSFTSLYNMTGQPAMSVPLHWTPSCVPVGVMFAARSADEATLFRLAAQLEQQVPWFKRTAAL